MAGTSTRLYGPLAALAAGLATAISSFEIAPPRPRPATLGPPPYLLYAAHPSMPVPPFSNAYVREKSPLSSSIESKSPSVDQVVWTVHRFVSDSLKTCSCSSLHFFPILPSLAVLSATDGSLLLRSSPCQPHYRSVVSSFSSSSKPSYPSIFSPTFAASKYIRSWHSKSSSKPQESTRDENERKNSKEVTVVLLGWLGAKQKHLKKYADWYTERGINAVTFVIPMSDMISFKAGGKAEQQIDHLAHHLLAWMEEEENGKEKHLFFHTFSNTGWLTYGVLLERLLQKNNKLLDKVKGCVVDSAPVAEPDPQVWASGFSAAFLKKKSVTTRKVDVLDILKHSSEEAHETRLQADVTEQALVSMLEKFFSVFLQLPYVKKRLSEVVTILSKQQPKCPQLYIYSTADRVIPAKSVESFMEEQRRSGRTVKACNLLWSPHVDHFRSFPDIYSSQLNIFIRECLSQWSPQKCA
ncbi:transmembrane protein 53 [Selaginella moellendorffii]|nr:transmembrane protein 53 [Selaginella moellendorffii]|eukprot:XP_002970474.2 transmembrane protein 53 [Selaginella moellendorffii]